MAEALATDIASLQITVAHHADNEFYSLARVMPTSGGAMLDWNGALITDVTHEVPPGFLFEAIHDASCQVVDGRSSCPDMCIILDACDSSGDIVTDKEITRQDADRLLDGQFDERLVAARDNLAAFYAHSDAARLREQGGE